VAAGDVNGDGVTDILFRNSDGSGINQWRPLLPNGSNLIGGGLMNFPDIITGPAPGTAPQIQVGGGLTFGGNTYIPIAGVNYDPGKSLGEMFREIFTNYCEHKDPGPWEVEPANYPPGADLPEASLT